MPPGGARPEQEPRRQHRDRKRHAARSRLPPPCGSPQPRLGRYLRSPPARQALAQTRSRARYQDGLHERLFAKDLKADWKFRACVPSPNPVAAPNSSLQRSEASRKPTNVDGDPSQQSRGGSHDDWQYGYPYCQSATVRRSPQGGLPRSRTSRPCQLRKRCRIEVSPCRRNERTSKAPLSARKP